MASLTRSRERAALEDDSEIKKTNSVLSIYRTLQGEMLDSLSSPDPTSSKTANLIDH